MKKLLALIFLTGFMIVSAQTKLVSHHLDLKKPKDSQQILNIVNTNTNEIYTIASDKENTTVLKFNSALFFSDSLSIKRPNEEYDHMAGFSIEKKQNPFVYWASKDLKKILAIQYDLDNKTTALTSYSLPLEDQTIITTFSENGAFYILCDGDEKEEKLVLYIFKNGTAEQKVFDFEPFNFVTKRGQTLKLNSLLEEYPIQTIDTHTFNPLFACTQKTKLYVTQNKLLLTFDHNPKETQLFEIDLTTYGLKEKKSLQPALKGDEQQSNSFFNNNQLYQLKLADTEMVLSIKDPESDSLIKSYTVSANDTITFKNSPLYSQTATQKPRKLKNTKKYLSRLSSSDIGISVYSLNNKLLLTIGGSRDVANSGLVVLGFAGMVTGNSAGIDLINSSDIQTNYFESIFDNSFQPLKDRQGPLAVDFIPQFMEEQDEASLDSTFRYKDYYIVGYYDNKAKQYMMWKFTDEDSPN